MEAKARDNTERTTSGDKLATTQGSGCGTLDRCFRHFPASGDRRARLPESATQNTNLAVIGLVVYFTSRMGVDRVTRALSYWTCPRRGLRHSWHRLSPPPSARHCPPDGTLVQLVGLLLAYHRRCNHRRAVPSLEAQPKYSTRLTVKTVPPKPWKPLSL